MSISIEDVDFSQLTPDERALLAYDLMESVRAEADASQVPAHFLAELQRRIAEIDAGAVSLLQWDQIRASVFEPG